MPLVSVGDDWTPYLVYEAPVDEKTSELRKQFKIDESGYPEHYKWRPLARLGREYNYTDPFYKLGEYRPEEYYSTKVTMVAMVTATCAGLHWFSNYNSGKKFYAGLHRFVGLTAAALGFLFWTSEKTMQRQAQKNHISIDYINKHPERFEKIVRPKLREVLFEYVPCR